MPLINTSVPNLIQGVSQQPDTIRYDGQCEEQENALSSVVDGLTKRPNTRHIARLLQTAISENSFIHFINRTDAEKYVIIHDGTYLRAFNILDGSAATINGATSLEVSASYLDVNPAFLKALTIGDNTLLLNNRRVVTETNDSMEDVSSEALIFVKQGDYGTKYGLSLQGNFEPQAGDNAVVTNTLTANTDGTYRLATATITTAGSGYEQGFVSISTSSSSSIITQPTFSIGVSNGGLNTLTVLNAGKFAANQTGTQSISHNCSITDYSTSSTTSGSYSYETRTTTVNFNLTINSGDTSHLQVGSTYTFNLYSYNNNFITYRDYGSTYGNYDQYTDEEDKQFTATVTSSNTLSVSKTYTYELYRSNNPTKYRGKEYRSNTGLASNVGTGINIGSFTSSKDTFGAPTVTLTVSPPTTTVNTARINAEITTPDGSAASHRNAIDTSAIAASLANDLAANITAASQQNLFNVTHSNNLIILAANASSVVGYTVSATDGLSDSGLGILYKEVSSISDLPVYCKNNFTLKVSGEKSEFEDDYYVKFQTNDGSAFGRGVWQETIGFNEKYKLDSSTLPHLLVSVAPNEFKFSKGDGSTVTTSSGDSFTFNKWAEKVAGDSDTNPSPSFVGKNIENILFFKNRLGFLTERSIILSEAGEFFNFYRTTVSTLLDSAPIDVDVGSSKVTKLKASAGFQGNLIIFSDSAQFVLKGGELLTPRTVSIATITNFSFETSVEPFPLGSYIYFPFTRGSYTGIREYNVNSATDNYDSADITEHVPNYIPKNIIGFTGTTTEDVIAVLSSSEPHSVFIYKYFWSGGKKLLSSWSKFTFRSRVIGIEFIDDVLYMVTNLNDETHIVSLPFEAGTKDPSGYLTHLDMRISITVPANNSVITLPYSINNDDNIQVWTKDGALLESTSFTNSVHLTQPVTQDTEVWVGLPYTMRYTFSEQVFKAAAGQGKSPSNIAKVMLKNVNLFYNNTAAFNVQITPELRDTFTSVFTSSIGGSGAHTLDSGAFRVPIFTKATKTVITIESDSALPCSFQSAEFESFVHSRSNRYG